MLGAGGLTPAAADAVAGFAAVQGISLVISLAVPVFVDLLGVVAGEEGRDIDLLGAARRAVPAGGAGDVVLAAHDGPHLLNGGPLRLGEGLEVLHEGGVILHLGQVAHAGKHYKVPLKPGGEPHRIAGRAAAVQLVQDQLGGGRQLARQAAALHRLHHRHRLVVLLAHLVAAEALDAGVVVVGVVELQLNELHLGMFAQDAVQHRRFVVEREARVAHFALGLQRLHRLKSAAGGVFFVVFGVDGVD